MPSLTSFTRGRNSRVSDDPMSAANAPLLPLPVSSSRHGDGIFSDLFTLSRWDRMLLFFGFLVAALIMFSTSFLLFPTGLFLLKPRKFAVLWTMGSIMFLMAWTIMMGPKPFAVHLFSQARLPFTTAYFGSIGLTLYFSLGLQSTILTFITSIIQIVCLLWYLASYFPFGSSGLRYAASYGTGRIASWMG